MSTDPITGATADLLPGQTGAAPSLVEPPRDRNIRMDETGQLRMTLSAGQLATDRADYIAIFDRNAASAKFEGHNASNFDAAARVAWIARFDAAVRAEGMEPTELPAADVVKHHEDHGLPFEPKAADYRPVFGEIARSLAPERLAVVDAETREWAAAVGFAPNLGTAVIERLSEIGPKLQNMTPEAREDWVRQQEAIALRMTGSDVALAEMKQRALAALKIAEGNKFSQAVANSTAMNDPWLLATLANHMRAVEAFAASHPSDRKKQ